MTSSQRPSLEWLASAGEMGKLVQDFAWDTTPLGPIDGWPQSLKTAVRIMLTSRYAMWMGWGPELTFLYNDSYAGMTLGEKHPWALGKRADEVWAEIWPDIGPLIETVTATGQATWSEGLLLMLERSGYSEETYHTFSYSPLSDDDGSTLGMLCVVTEETDRVVGARRLATLADVSSVLTGVRSETDVLDRLALAIGRAHKDIPFAALFLQSGQAEFRLARSIGIRSDHPSVQSPIWFDSFSQIGSGKARQLPSPIQTDAWPKPIAEAAIIRIAGRSDDIPVGYIIAGLNPHRHYDQPYASFLELVAGQASAAFASARVLDEERARAQALADIDKAKTAFFSNVSHEFRTPLTLMLAPLEELKQDVEQQMPLTERHVHQISLLERNSQRLLRLTNTLLDFSRIEAGRVRATFEPTDLCALTSDLASGFRSAIEKAGLALVIDCSSLAEPAFVDREMWEKIVLNLLSNAYKFTFEGTITVKQQQSGASITLEITDTGLGIPAHELPRVFDRFHRVEGSQGRTHEGSGIGLALVQELVRLHGGKISVESTAGRGTTFKVVIPAGHAHLPTEQIRLESLPPRASIARNYADEVMRWLPDEYDDQLDLAKDARAEPSHGKILVADDNADMRNYLLRLLSPRYDVTAVSDGAAAWREVHDLNPDLIVSDVMMPRTDGFELLQKLRSDQRTRNKPVILLSARAGEEARVDGLATGADEYITKPFSARELLARIDSQLKLADARRASELQAANILNSMTDGYHHIDKDWNLSPQFNTVAQHIFGGQGIDISTLMGRHVFDAFPDARGTPAGATLIEAMTRRLATSTESYYPPWRKWFDVRHYPTDDGGVATFFQDITARKEAEMAKNQLAAIVASANEAIVSKTLDSTVTTWNRGAETMFGYTAAEMLGASIRQIIPADRQAEEDDILRRIGKAELIRNYETVRITKDGRLIDISVTISPIVDDTGKIIGASKIAHDISDRKRAEERERTLMKEVNHRAKNMLAVVQSIARQTATKSPDDFMASFTTRIRSLAASQDVLVHSGWQNISLDALVMSQLGHFAPLIGKRVVLDGRPVQISAAAAQPIALALHELATNAAKYGALSNATGSVALRWQTGDDGQFAMEWSEKGGPPVKPPARRGFGSQVTGDLIRLALNGNVEIGYAIEGFAWRLTCSLEKVLDSSDLQQFRTGQKSKVNGPAPRRVLIVEDEPLIAMEVAEMMQDAGFDVVGPAASVAQALALIGEAACEVAILDINLGHETSEAVAHHLTNKGIPFVTVSGYNRAQMPAAYGTAPHVAKPLDADNIVALVQSCMHQSTQRWN